MINAGRPVSLKYSPIDGKGPIAGETYEMPVERKAPGVIYREPVTEPLQTGIKAIDAMIPVGRGQRELVIGDRQTGKTTVCIDTILNQKEFYDAGEPVYCIYVAVGQKASTVANIAKTLEDRGALAYTTIVAIIYAGSKNLLKDVPVDKVKEFERDFIEFLNAKHRDVLDTLKAGKLTDEVIDTLTNVTKDLTGKFRA